MTITPEQSDEACAREAARTFSDLKGPTERRLLEVLIRAARLSREREAARHAEPPVDQDVLDVRGILHAHHRAMTPPDSGWGDMSYDRGSYDHLPVFRAALATYRTIKSERGWP